MGKHNTSKSHASNTPKAQPPKRPGASSGDADNDAEILIDSLLGALSDLHTMERFISSLCDVPDIKSKFIVHLLHCVLD